MCIRNGLDKFVKALDKGTGFFFMNSISPHSLIITEGPKPFDYFSEFLKIGN